jgi:hypothetical protein
MAAISMIDGDVGAEMRTVLQRQKAAHLRDGAPTAEQRVDRIERCISLLVDHRRAIEDALDADFGARSKATTALADIAGGIGPLRFAKDNVRRWMRTEKRKTDAGAAGPFRGEGGGALPAQGRGRGDLALELPGAADLRAAGRRAGGRQPGDDQAVRASRRRPPS